MVDGNVESLPWRPAQLLKMVHNYLGHLLDILKVLGIISDQGIQYIIFL